MSVTKVSVRTTAASVASRAWSLACAPLRSTSCGPMASAMSAKRSIVMRSASITCWPTRSREARVGRGRKKVTLVHKANVLKALTGLFLEAGREVAKEYEGRVEVDDRIVDACAMQLVMNPWQFDVIVTTNLFGDILSDQLAGLVGGLGMAPGANIGEKAAIFEAVHGSAPDIAGKGVAN